MDKPRIITKINRDNKDKISKIIIKDVAKKVGYSCYVAFPKELLGKYLEVEIKVIQ